MRHDDGIVPTRIPHFRFALILIMGKFLDSLTTLFVLKFAPETYESVWFTRQIMAATTPYIGTILITLLAVVLLTILAISLDFGSRYLPAIRGRDTVCYWGAVSIYVGGTFYYTYAAAHNLVLLV